MKQVFYERQLLGENSKDSPSVAVAAFKPVANDPSENAWMPAVIVLRVIEADRDGDDWHDSYRTVTAYTTDAQLAREAINWIDATVQMHKDGISIYGGQSR